MRVLLVDRELPLVQQQLARLELTDLGCEMQRRPEFLVLHRPPSSTRREGTVDSLVRSATSETYGVRAGVNSEHTTLALMSAPAARSTRASGMPSGRCATRCNGLWPFSSTTATAHGARATHASSSASVPLAAHINMAAAVDDAASIFCHLSTRPIDLPHQSPITRHQAPIVHEGSLSREPHQDIGSSSRGGGITHLARFRALAKKRREKR